MLTTKADETDIGQSGCQLLAPSPDENSDTGLSRTFSAINFCASIVTKLISVK